MPVTTNFDSYAVAHNKNGGGGGGNTYVMGGQNSSTYNSLNVHSINANLGNIDTLKSKSISANEASILYLQTREGSIQKLSGDLFDFNSGYVGSLASDSISTKQLKAEDIEAVNAFISTLQSKEITTEYLTVTKQAHFFELIIDKIRSVGGRLILTPASCIIDYVYGVTQDGSWVKPTEQNRNDLIAFDVFWRSTDDNGRNVTNDFIPGDQAICQSFNNVHTETNYNISNKYYWRLVESVQDDDVWINLSTGAIAPSREYATNNKYEISMLNTVTKDEINSTTQDVYRGNGIIWQCEAQQIIGYQTNVSWTDNTLGYNQAINGIFETASMVYGIQITPSASNPILGITSRLEFYIKQIVDNSYIIPNKINIGVYFQDNTFRVFNDVALDSTSGYISLDLDSPEAPIEAITIVSTSDVNWHQCHTMRISNVTCDRMLDEYSSIPSAGDNLVQLGYRGQDKPDRQSAIIISGSGDKSSPDPDIHAPSYAAYMGINDFNLGSHRGSYIDARGAKFIGDITMCSIDGQSIGDTFNDLETKNKKILSDTATIKVWPVEGSISGQVNRIDPSSINVTILTPGQNGMDLLNSVPEGYTVAFNFFSTNTDINVSQYDFNKTQNQSLSNISMPTGQNVGDINSVRIRLIKNEAGVPVQNAIVVDYVDIPYIQAVLPAVDGGRYEFRYTNFTPTTGHTTPTKPTAGTDGIDKTYGTGADAATWHKSVSSPDVAHNQFTYMTQCYCTANNEYDVWTDPVRITGNNGKDGEDGTDIEFIYTKKSTIWQNPTAPTVSDDPTIAQDDWPNVDGHTPSKTIIKDGVSTTWTDNPVGVTSSERYEYMSVRYKYAGTSNWSAYSTPVIWSAFGDKGQDGDGFEYMYKLADSVPQERLYPENWYDPTSDYQKHDEYVSYLSSLGWHDDPLTPTSQTNHTVCYVATRKKYYDAQYGRVLWHPFSTPAMWAMYVFADGAEPGAPGENAQYDYLIPNREVLMAKIIDAYANNGNCDLLCDLGYNLVHVDGDTVTTINDWAGNGYILHIAAFNYSYQKIWETTDNDGAYTVSNLMATINSVADHYVDDYRDYMKCYENSSYRNRCPVYLQVSLFKNSDVLDKRCVPVQLETGALLKVQNDGIRSIVGDTENNTVTGWVNLYYSTKQQTATDISSAVTGIYNNFYTKDNTYNRSEIDQKDSGITSTVESIRTNVYTKEETYNKSTIDQKDNAIKLSVTNGLEDTGIDITHHTIELQADNVTFTNSAGTINNKIWIDSSSGTLHATDAELTGQMTVTSGTNRIVIDSSGFEAQWGGEGIRVNANGIQRYDSVRNAWLPMYNKRNLKIDSSYANIQLTPDVDYFLNTNNGHPEDNPRIIYLPDTSKLPEGAIVTIRGIKDVWGSVRPYNGSNDKISVSDDNEENSITMQSADCFDFVLCKHGFRYNTWLCNAYDRDV